MRKTISSSEPTGTSSGPRFSELHHEEQREAGLLRRREVERLTGMPRSTIYREVARGAFPAPVQLSGRSVAWSAREVFCWIDSKLAERARK